MAREHVVVLYNVEGIQLYNVNGKGACSCAVQCRGSTVIGVNNRSM